MMTIWKVIGLWLVLQVPLAMLAGKFLSMQHEPNQSALGPKE